MMLSIVIFLLGFIFGHFTGVYRREMIDKIRTLVEQGREPKPEPVKPAVVGGAYQPPKEISPVPDTKRKAGIAEAKTPQQIEWENKQELDNLGS